MNPLSSSLVPHRIALIVCSQRRPRLGPEIVSWVRSTILDVHDQPSICLETVDLSLYNLPIFDEPVLPREVPTKSNYTQDHTIRWSKTVASFSAFIFVTPQYNGGYPASVKNALDYLYNEWYDKPAMVVCYGNHGGGKGGAQLAAVLKHMRMRVVGTMPQLGIKGMEVGDGEGNISQSKKTDWETARGEVLKGFEEFLEMLSGFES